MHQIQNIQDNGPTLPFLSQLFKPSNQPFLTFQGCLVFCFHCRGSTTWFSVNSKLPAKKQHSPHQGNKRCFK